MQHLFSSFFLARPARSGADPESPDPGTSSPEWRQWLEYLFGAFGCALVLAGVIYFFAFNWAELSKWTKFALVEGLFVLCLAGAWRCGLTSRAGEIFVCTASVLVGVFLAVFGQIYQTGANVWQLFAAWAAFIAVWTLLARNAAQWAVLLVLLNVAVALHGMIALDRLEEPAIWQLTLLNAVALAGREFALSRGALWLRNAWTGMLPLLPLLAAATTAICIAMIERSPYHGMYGGDRSALLGALCLVGVCAYFHHRGEVSRLALTLLCGFPILNVFFCMHLLRHWRDLEIVWVLGGLNIGYAVAATAWLRRLHHARQEETAGPEISGSGSGPESEPESSQDAPEAPAVKRMRPAGMPVAVMIVHSIGGLLGAALFTLAIGITMRGLDGLLGLGMVFTIGGSLLFRLLHGRKQEQEKKRGGYAGLSFCFSIVLLGVGLYMINVLDGWSFWSMFSGLSVLLAVVYVLFDHPLMRFAAVAAWGATLFAHSLTPSSYVEGGPSPYMLVLSLSAACSLPLALHALGLRIRESFIPAAYAGVCLLIGVVAGFVIERSFNFYSTEMPLLFPNRILLWILAAILMLLVGVEVRKIPGGVTRRTAGHMAAACLALAGLIWLNALGVLLGLNLLLLGHGRELTPLKILGFIFLPCFLTVFYYELNTTLLVKSAILCGSGAILLLGATYLRLAFREVRPCAR